MKSYVIKGKILVLIMIGLGMGIDASAIFFTDLGYTVKSDLSKQELNRLGKIQTCGQDSLVLSKEKVGNWIKLRIKVAKLQNNMKSNAQKYEDVVESFYREREDLLISQGWTVMDFDEAKVRIHAAISAMNIAEELQDSRSDHKRGVSEISQNEYYSVSQKEQMIEGLKSIRKQQREQYIQPTKNDWAAVRPHRSFFKEVQSWIAGNRSDLPKSFF